MQKELFPQSGNAFDDASVNVVLAAPEGHTLGDSTYAPLVAGLVEDILDLPQMSQDPALNPQLGNPVELSRLQSQQYLDAAQASGGDRGQARTDAKAVSPLADGGRARAVRRSGSVGSARGRGPTSRSGAASSPFMSPSQDRQGRVGAT